MTRFALNVIFLFFVTEITSCGEVPLHQETVLAKSGGWQLVVEPIGSTPKKVSGASIRVDEFLLEIRSQHEIRALNALHGLYDPTLIDFSKFNHGKVRLVRYLRYTKETWLEERFQITEAGLRVTTRVTLKGKRADQSTIRGLLERIALLKKEEEEVFSTSDDEEAMQKAGKLNAQSMTLWVKLLRYGVKNPALVSSEVDRFARSNKADGAEAAFVGQIQTRLRAMQQAIK